MKKSDAISYFKTQTAIAKALTRAGYEITQPAVSKWGEMIPEVPARILSTIADGNLDFDESAYRSPAARPPQEAP